uniref:Calmodulin binding transcription activator 1 n=1 Tax=Chrysemys picta bellii TaxID=8478 RepID=A0A8C3HSS3_CHRPI
MWRAEGKWLPKTSRKVRARRGRARPLSPAGERDDHGNSNGSHVKIFLPKKLLECLPKCSSLPKERHRWNTNEVANFFSFDSTFLGAYWLFSCSRKLRKYCR